jgi:hypothetical protein
VQVGLILSKGTSKNEAKGLTNVLLCKKVLFRSLMVGSVNDLLEVSARAKTEMAC